MRECFERVDSVNALALREKTRADDSRLTPLSSLSVSQEEISTASSGMEGEAMRLESGSVGGERGEGTGVVTDRIADGFIVEEPVEVDLANEDSVASGYRKPNFWKWVKAVPRQVSKWWASW